MYYITRIILFSFWGVVLQNEFLDRQYKLIEAWKLFANEGIYKTDHLDSAELKLWQQSKLLGANPLLDYIKLKKQEEINSDIEFDKEINLWAIENSLAILLFNQDKILVKKSAFEFENLNFELGSYFDDAIIGISALSLSINSNEYRCLKGAQHFLKAFQYYVTRAYPFDIMDKKYYFLIINHISNENTSLKSEIKKHLDKYINRISGKHEDKHIENKHFEAGIYEISSNGKVSYTELSNLAVLQDGDNVLSIFEDCSLSDIFSGKKQIVTYKNNTFRKYVITPISKKNQYSTYILLEKLSSSIDLFEPYHKTLNESFTSFINKDRIPTDVMKRLKALANSTMPVMFVIDSIDEQLLFSSYINTLRRDSYNYYINLDPTKNLNKNLEDNLKEINKWTGFDNKSSVHIFNISLLDSKNADKALGDCFYTHNLLSKYFIYVDTKYYNILNQDNQNIMSSFNLNIMKISDEIILALKTAMNNSILTKNDVVLDESEEVFVSRFKKDKNYSLSEIEKNSIIDALVSVDYNMTKASILLDISRSTLYRKLKEYNIKSN